MSETLLEYCERIEDQTLLAQWHPTKNGDLTFSDVTFGSNRRIWWKCEKGHAWQSAVKTRATGCGCPVCSGRLLSPGENDLASVYPEVAAEWHPTRNGGLTPRDVMGGTSRKVWWQCKQGHEWQARVNARVRGVGCPVCTGKQVVPGENDLASLYPAVAKEWDREKNGGLTPEQVSQYSNRRVWWKCGLGHTYRAPVSHRTMRASGCPYCAGRQVLRGFNDLATLRPDLAKQWHPALNAPLTPEQVTVGSHRKIWWECGEGHVWKAVLYSRTGRKQCGCPVCAGVVKESTRRRYAVPAGQQMTRP